MIAQNACITRKMFSGAEVVLPCPDCGSIMREVERLNENGFSFIWYKCTRPDCGGHWLERRIAAIRDY